MKNTKIFFSQEFYEKHLCPINNVHFTNREIDVIACLLNARGTSKIASFLSVNPRTVETHVRNIMSKLECNTRESIIDFIEASDKLPFLRKYYSLLQNEMIFEKSLKDISKLTKERGLRCLLIQETDTDPFIFHLKSWLDLAGILTSIAAREKKGDYTIFVLPKILTEEILHPLVTKIEKSQNKVLLLLQERKNSKEISHELMKWDIIDFAKEEDYFLGFFALLNKLLLHLDLDKIVTEFKDKYKKEPTDSKLLQVSLNEKPLENSFLYQRWGYFVSMCFLIALIGGGFLAFNWSKKNNGEITLRSDLVLPVGSVFLNRPEVMAQIDEAFKGKEGIQTVALVGVGGSGKTTAARQYAHQQKAPLIWEINAETKSNLTESFENLAHALAISEEDERTLLNLTDVKNSAERDKRLIEFVKEHLRLHSNWFLIYDNLEKFTDVKKYFPLDPKTWGTGRTLITTRNSNIHNNNAVSHVIQIDELNESQKLSLFTKIMNQDAKNFHINTPITESKKFLENIPPFPLDVSMAAYYLRTTNIPYQQYIEYLGKNDVEFSNIQEKILNESTEYSKTRHAIITVSLKQLIDAHPDFRDLLLLIALLDARNIPHDLLNQYKGKIIVDKFLYHANKNSLISDRNFLSSSHPNISIHRSIQNIILGYLMQKMNITDNDQSIKKTGNVFKAYVDLTINDEKKEKTYECIIHAEKLLSHDHLLSEELKKALNCKLGIMNYLMGNDEKAKFLLERNIDNIEKYHSSVNKTKHFKVSSDVTQALLYLGNVYRKLGDYEKAKNLILQALSFYKENKEKDHVEVARGWAYLASVYRNLGDYGNAKNALEKSLILYQRNFKDNLGYARTLTLLGCVYEDLGMYEKAKGLLEQSLIIYNKSLGEHHIDSGWVLVHLGNVHVTLKNYEAAKHRLEQASFVYKKKFGRDHIHLVWISIYLSNLYKNLHDYEKAKTILQKSLNTYEKYYGVDHCKTAEVLRNLGEVSQAESHFEDAKEYFKKALYIFQKNKHPDVYIVLEDFAELYLKKSTSEKNNRNTQQAQNLKTQAIDYLEQALEVATTHFPADSPHITRIQKKLKSLEQDYKPKDR